MFFISRLYLSLQNVENKVTPWRVTASLCKVWDREVNQYKDECSESIAHFVSNVDLFFILFNNKLSTICPKLVRLGVLSWSGAKEGEGRWWIMRESINRSIKMERKGKDGKDEEEEEQEEEGEGCGR